MIHNVLYWFKWLSRANNWKISKTHVNINHVIRITYDTDTNVKILIVEFICKNQIFWINYPLFFSLISKKLFFKIYELILVVLTILGKVMGVFCKTPWACLSRFIESHKIENIFLFLSQNLIIETVKNYKRLNLIN